VEDELKAPFGASGPLNLVNLACLTSLVGDFYRHAYRQRIVADA
jgi:hypothetical protein